MRNYPVMKKAILFLFGLLLSCSLFAQEGLHFGFGGLGQNTWIINPKEAQPAYDIFDYKLTFGYGGYAQLGYNFVDPIGLHLGAIYSVQGQNNSATDTLGNSLTFKRQLTYLKIPLTIRFSSEVNRAMFYFGAGAYYGILMSANQRIDDTDVVYPFATEDLYNDRDLGLSFYLGGAFDLYDEKIWWTVDIYGDRGLQDMENKEFTFAGVPVYGSERAKSTNFNVGLRTGINFVINPSGGGRNAGQFWIR